LRKKIIVSFLVTYGIFIACIYFYLFIFHTDTIPAELKGTSVDPERFLTAHEIVLSEQYSTVRNFLFFIEVPFEWFFYLLILLFGIGNLFEKWANRTTPFTLIHNAIFTFCLSFLTFIFFYPLKFFRYTLSKNYGISTQSFHDWMRDLLINFWLDWFLLFIVVSVLYWLIRKSENRWWLYKWFLAIPFVVFLMFIQPVVIDPLFNDFYEIKNKSLEEKILSLAETAGIPSEHVYEVNMSEKTNALNAYVTGVGSNSRIVLYDTTLEKLNEDEILFIMAHEMAHYVEKHIYFGITGYLSLLFLLLFVVAKLAKKVIKKFGKLLHISSMNNLASLPLILLIVSVLTFATSPISNVVSRQMEMRADLYAMELTKNNDAAVSTFQKLTKTGLSQVNPPTLVKWFRYGHPTMLERIQMAERYGD
jgi:STE24 endopeptidase